MRTVHRLLLVALALFAGALALSACGSKDASDKSVGDLLASTFGGKGNVKSGRLDLDLTLDLKGAQGVSGPIRVKLTGPFSRRKKDIPEFNVKATLAAGGQTLTGGAASVGDQGFVAVRGADYSLEKAVFDNFRAAFRDGQAQRLPAPCRGLTLSKLGIQPNRWLRDARKVGEQSIGGDKTIHIQSGVDLGKLLRDVNGLLGRGRSCFAAQGRPAVNQLTPAEITQLSKAVRNARIDVFTGRSDEILRRLTVALDVQIPAAERSGSRGLSAIGLKLTFQVTNINEKQEIKAPANPRPFSELAAALQGSGLGGGATGATGATGAAAPAPTPAPSTGSGAASSAAAKAYLDCLNAARTDRQRAQCVGTLGLP